MANLVPPDSKLRYVRVCHSLTKEVVKIDTRLN